MSFAKRCIKNVSNKKKCLHPVLTVGEHFFSRARVGSFKGKNGKLSLHRIWYLIFNNLHIRLTSHKNDCHYIVIDTWTERNDKSTKLFVSHIKCITFYKLHIEITMKGKILGITYISLAIHKMFNFLADIFQYNKLSDWLVLWQTQ